MPLWRSAVHPDKIIFTRGKFSRLRGTGEFAEARQSIVHRRTARERSCRMERLARERHVAPLWAFGLVLAYWCLPDGHVHRDRADCGQQG